MARLDLEHGPWKQDHWWVSQFNFEEDITSQTNLMGRKISFHDSTLRDGEQAPGIVFSAEQKMEIAKRLSEAGVQYIEAGFPAISEAEQKSLKNIAEAGLSAKITCLCRAMEKDIDIAKNCGVNGAIIELPVSYPRIKYQFGWQEKDVIEKALRVTEYARKSGLEVYLFLIDSTRAHIEFLEELITTTVASGCVDRLSIVDTNGCVSPEGMGALVRKARGWVNIPVEVHCHNDFGLGVANTISSLKNGADSASATISALGQRAGNTSLEELVMALQCLYGADTGIDVAKLYDVSCLVREWSGWSFPPNSPVVGTKLFTWEAGIPTAALAKNPFTVEPVMPELFGRRHDVVVGKKSGKANLQLKAKELGLDVREEELPALLDEVKAVATRLQRALTDDEFAVIVKRQK